MSAPTNWENEAYLPTERKMEILVKEIMSIQSAIEVHCGEETGKHAIEHCDCALRLAVNLQDHNLNTELDKDYPNLQNFYFTFSTGDVIHSNHFVKMEQMEYFSARTKMREHFGAKWAFQYTEHEWIDADGVSQAERYGYTEFKLNE